jgi:hypothetical protein
MGDLVYLKVRLEALKHLTKTSVRGLLAKRNSLPTAALGLPVTHVTSPGDFKSFWRPTFTRVARNATGSSIWRHSHPGIAGSNPDPVAEISMFLCYR